MKLDIICQLFLRLHMYSVIITSVSATVYMVDNVESQGVTVCGSLENVALTVSRPSDIM